MDQQTSLKGSGGERSAEFSQVKVQIHEQQM